MEYLKTIELESFNQSFQPEFYAEIIRNLEEGKVIYLPKFPFKLRQNEQNLLCPTKVDPKSKNVSYDIRTNRLAGASTQGEETQTMKEMIRRYALHSQQLIKYLFPTYIPHLIQARTSFRPVEASGRVSSYRKDDTLLHVDAFPATPSRGQRILRVFSNVNPENKARVWRLGEPFHNVVENFAPKAKKPFPGLFFLLKQLKITKDYRTLYDHYMLQIHDTMKGDREYQQVANQEEIHFPPGSTWIVYTDSVSHAAMGGQHLFEQTFHLSAENMDNSELSPLRILERFFNQRLV